MILGWARLLAARAGAHIVPGDGAFNPVTA
jgi:hypothetical protein